MLALIQRVKAASVTVQGKCIGEIQQGILALIGIEKKDSMLQGEKLIKKILNYRIFEDTNHKMNLSLHDIRGGLLLVPQFTLVADTNSGTRASFSTAMHPEQSEKLFLEMMLYAKNIFPDVQQGEFGANMQVSLCNDGPVTFILSA